MDQGYLSGNVCMDRKDSDEIWKGGDMDPACVLLRGYGGFRTGACAEQREGKGDPGGFCVAAGDG